jgi:bacteriorhodopsin
MSLLASLGPRILGMGFFSGPTLIKIEDPAILAKNVAFILLFITFASALFSSTPWIALIPGIACWAYGNMLSDTPHTDMYRYTDWALTTPLMLAAILSANNVGTATLLGVVALDLVMIATGYLGATATEEATKLGMFGVGCLALAPILYVLYSLKKAKYAIYLTILMWSLYPVVWYLDEESHINKSTATIAYSYLDVITKSGLVYFLQI